MSKSNSPINILFIGDICGRPGREAVRDVLPELRRQYNIDLVVADVENLAHGRGATVKTVEEVLSYGVDFLTAGNHIWRGNEFEDVLSGYPIIRAFNYPDDIIGKGYEIIELSDNRKVLISTILGQFGINDPVATNPLRAVDELLAQVDTESLDAIIIEYHAEATSEKVTMGFYLDGLVTAVLGTHTHVPTADERILPKGTAYITDIGMVGPLNSSLWVDTDIIVQQMKYPYSPRYEIVETKPYRFDAVLVSSQGPQKASQIKRINKIL